MSYSERAYAGPDIWGRKFNAEPVSHCAARDENLHIERRYREARAAYDRRRRAR